MRSTNKTAARKRLSKSHSLSLAPMVVGMRLPILVMEAMSPFPGHRKPEGERMIMEKSAAVIETFGAVQAEMMQAWTGMWFAMLAGEKPDAVKFSRALEDITEASMAPSARRVKANYRRLRSRGK